MFIENPHVTLFNPKPCYSKIFDHKCELLNSVIDIKDDIQRKQTCSYCTLNTPFVRYKCNTISPKLYTRHGQKVRAI